MNVLVLNSGSSSMKFQLINSVDETSLITGLVQRIGLTGATIEWELADGREFEDSFDAKDHTAAIEKTFSSLIDSERGAVKDLKEVDAIGHRVVHGGEKFKDSVIITDEVLAEIKKCSALAPLHNPPNITGIEACTELLGPDVPQIAVFDTSFHAQMPEKAFLYALPRKFYEEDKVRRYGFHGTSHKYVARKAIEILGLDPKEAKIITCHLGNGGSISAVKGDHSVDTTMGLTPLEGIVMGTRSGDMDPAISVFLMKKHGYTAADIDKIYNKESGLLGLSGISSDMREIIAAAEKGDTIAQAAMDVFVYKIQKYIGSYLATLNGADAIIFTAGVGENSYPIRSKVCANLEGIGIEVDDALNKAASRKEMVFSKESSRIKVMVLPTNEELVIAQETAKLVK